GVRPTLSTTFEKIMAQSLRRVRAGSGVGAWRCESCPRHARLLRPIAEDDISVPRLISQLERARTVSRERDAPFLANEYTADQDLLATRRVSRARQPRACRHLRVLRRRGDERSVRRRAATRRGSGVLP